MSESAEHLKLVEPTPAPEPPKDPLVGTTVDGRYELVDKLGEGGMGVVYHARHVVLQKDLAMKVLRADVSRDGEIIARFRQEAQSASAIGSQHIIDISDFGQLPDGSTYFVMEYLKGRELTKVIECDKPIGTDRLVAIAKQLCDALGAAHEAGIVHRDMKPDNVFLIPRGGTDDFVKVLDFGIAKVGGASSKLTKAGQVFGTPHYMSPEQCSGQGVDHRTDIYAIGIILYEMASGKVPFDADNLMGILTKHIYEQPIPLHQLPPPTDVPAGLEAIILKCLAKSTDQRYQSMAEVRADLEAFQAGSTPEAVMDAVNRTGPHGAVIDPTSQSGLRVGVGGAYAEPPRSKTPLIIGALFGLAAVLGAVAALYFLVLAPPPPTPETDPVSGNDTTATGEETTGQETTGQETAGEETAGNETDDEDATEATGEDQGAEPPPPPVQLNIVSIPEGVEVWLGEEGEATLLGNTPMQLPRPTEGERMLLTLRHPGFEDHSVRVSHLTQPEISVTLRAARRTATRRGGRSRQPRQQEATQVEAAPPPPPPPPRPQGRGEVLNPWGD